METKNEIIKMLFDDLHIFPCHSADDWHGDEKYPCEPPGFIRAPFPVAHFAGDML